MQLRLQTRQVGETFVVQCSGRLIAGDEVLKLQDEVKKCLQEPFGIVVHLGEVTFLDSSGLGALVRLLASARTARRKLSLCSVPEIVRKTLTLTNVLPLFDTHETEEDAVRAIHQNFSSGEEEWESSSPRVVCLAESAEVRACLSALLKRAGYRPLTTVCLHDALILQKAVRAKSIIVGHEIIARQPSARKSLGQIEPAANMVELDADFSRQDAGQAAERLLQSLRVSQSQSKSNSGDQ